jgi:hypothetical protein
MPNDPDVPNRRKLQIAGFGAAVVLVVGGLALIVNRDGDAATEPAPVPTPVTTPSTSQLTSPSASSSTSPTTTSLPSEPDAVGIGGWTAIEELATSQVVSDGRMFFALGDLSASPELWHSDDGTTWKTLGAVPFSQIESIQGGSVIGHNSAGDATEVLIVEADGTITELNPEAVVPAEHRSFVEHVELKAYLGDGTVAVESNYRLSIELVIADALGVPIEDIVASRDARNRGELDEGEIFPHDALIAAGVGAPIEEFRQRFDGGLSINETTAWIEGPEPITVPLGTRGPLVFGQPEQRVRAVVRDGATWEYSDVTVERPASVAAIDGGFVGWDDSSSPDSQPPSVSVDGAEWTPIVEVGTGAALPPGGDLRTGGGRALYLAAATTTTSALWEITMEGAIAIETAGTPVEAVRVGSGAARTLTIGDAGIAYLTDFRGGGVEGVHSPSAIVTSTDGSTWVAEPWPAAIGGHRVSLAIGSTGIVATVSEFEAGTISLWNRKFAAP